MRLHRPALTAALAFLPFLLVAAAPARAADAPSNTTPERRVSFGFESGPPASLRLNERGNLVGWAPMTDRSLFVLVPVGAKFQIRTALTGTDGKYACLGVRDNTGSPDTLVAAQCRPTAQGQLFTFPELGTTDSVGRPQHEIKTAAGRLTFDYPNGLHLKPGSAGSVSAFTTNYMGPGC